jgi:hypothetical protein
VHRRGAPGAGGDEADRHGAARAADLDTTTGEAAVAHHQRSDVCAVPAAGVVAEAMVALVLAESALEKFGGDSVAETRRNYEAYLKHRRRPEACGFMPPDDRAVVLVGGARAPARPPSGGPWRTASELTSPTSTR